MPLTEALAQKAADSYANNGIDRYKKLVGFIDSECTELVRNRGIPATVQSRVKRPDSVHGKLLRYVREASHKVEFMDDSDDLSRVIGDLAGVRIATYVEGDRGRVVRAVQSHFRNVIEEVHNKKTGYRATHCEAMLPERYRGLEDAANVFEVSFEIQVCSMLAHVWNEVEHDMRYKLDSVDEVSPYELSRLQQLHIETEDGDNVIEEMLTARSERIAEGLVDQVRPHFPQCPDFDLNAKYALTVLVRLGYRSEAEIRKRLLNDGYLDRSADLIVRLNDSLAAMDEVNRLLNQETSDPLLALMLAEHHADICGLYFRDIGSGRAKPIAFLAQFGEENDLFT
jgi:ppGpp synthetase/RelA/SpoT-type nucleotidyltranferase